MKRLVTLLIALLMCGILTSGQSPVEQQTLEVHGRLSRCNGDIGTYIWIVGTKRHLGVRESSEEIPDMPNELLDLLGPWEKARKVYADFMVEPVTPYRDGIRQMVRIVSAKNIVVVEDGKIVLMKKELALQTSDGPMICGHVVDEFGRPVEAALVQCSWEKGGFVGAKTDSRGAYCLPARILDRPCDVRVEATEGCPSLSLSGYSFDRNRTDFTLQGCFTIPPDRIFRTDGEGRLCFKNDSGGCVPPSQEEEAQDVAIASVIVGDLLKMANLGAGQQAYLSVGRFEPPAGDFLARLKSKFPELGAPRKPQTEGETTLSPASPTINIQGILFVGQEKAYVQADLSRGNTGGAGFAYVLRKEPAGWRIERRHETYVT